MSVLVLAMAAMLSSVVQARTSVSISMGGFAVQYLPVTVALAKNFFKDEGLEVHLETFQAGGGSALEALVGGSTDAVAGYYDHTVQMQLHGKDVRCVTLVDQFPGLVLAVRKDLSGEIQTVADLKGRRVGVTDLGGNSYIQLRYLASKAGVPMSSLTVVAVGSGATSVAAIEHNQVDALTAYEPGASMLESRGLITTLFDTRTLSGTVEAYGAPYPAACLYTTELFIEEKPETVQKLVNGVARALKWMKSASPDDIVAALPSDYLIADRQTMTAAIARTKTGYPTTGYFEPAILNHAIGVLTAANPAIKSGSIDVSKTYTNKFVDAVPKNLQDASYGTGRN